MTSCCTTHTRVLSLGPIADTRPLLVLAALLRAPVHLDALHALGVVLVGLRAQLAGAPQPHRLAVVEDEGKHEGEEHHDAAVDAEGLDEPDVEDPVGGLEADQETGNETERGHGYEDGSAGVVSLFRFIIGS